MCWWYWILEWVVESVVRQSLYENPLKAMFRLYWSSLNIESSLAREKQKKNKDIFVLFWYYVLSQWIICIEKQIQSFCWISREVSLIELQKSLRRNSVVFIYVEWFIKLVNKHIYENSFSHCVLILLLVRSLEINSIFVFH